MDTVNHFKENLYLTYKILEEVLTQPYLRFNQILWHLGITDDKDRFYENSEETVKRVKEREIKCSKDIDFLGR